MRIYKEADAGPEGLARLQCVSRIRLPFTRHTRVYKGSCQGRNFAILLPFLDPGESESSSTTEGLGKIGQNSAEPHEND